ncbi:unnamed protein product [Caenorhabditis angaria]|uniref:F-box domain-containing protein n=1 Tax=Caenorhabditis angaria TaxID=860376 RepID=A0A9P1I7G9_9PELO|nr:unnamed protein product [Caenorhabditis angaria]
MEPKTKKKKLENDSKTTGWFDIPLEMREIVMNLMDFQTMLNFSQCSIDCLEEGKLSKTTLISFSENEYGDHGGCIEITPENRGSPTYIRKLQIIKLDNQLKHSFAVDSKKERSDVLLQNFRGLLKTSRNRLKCLDINVEGFPYNRIKIGKLPNLQEIHLTSYSMNQSVDPIRCGFIDFEQICAVRNWVKVPKLSVAQILKMKAKLIEIECKWERQDIGKLIDRILDGEIDENVDQIRLTTKVYLKTVPGIFARRRWGWGQECFAERNDKHIRIHIESDSVVISTKCKPYRVTQISDYFERNT